MIGLLLQAASLISKAEKLTTLLTAVGLVLTTWKDYEEYARKKREEWNKTKS